MRFESNNLRILISLIEVNTGANNNFRSAVQCAARPESGTNTADHRLHSAYLSSISRIIRVYVVRNRQQVALPTRRNRFWKSASGFSIRVPPLSWCVVIKLVVEPIPSAITSNPDDPKSRVLIVGVTTVQNTISDSKRCCKWINRSDRVVNSTSFGIDRSNQW